MKNRIARIVKIGKIKIFEEDLPSLEPGQILVKIRAVGICGSDMHYFKEGGLGSFKQKLPMDIGHEPAGEVVETNSLNFKKGDRVAIEPGRPCLTCEWCLKGKHNLCEKGKFMVTNIPGAFADYIVADEIQLTKISKKMSFEKAALMEPFGVALHAINLTNPDPLEAVSIIGAGPIGLALLSILKKRGFTKIYLVDKLLYRVKFAKKIGATKSFLFKDAKNEIMKLTNGKGTRYVFDSGGTNDTVNLSIEVVGVAGTFTLVGIPTEDCIEINPHKARAKEIVIRNVRRSNQTLIDCIKLFEDDKSIERIITHKIKFKDIQKLSTSWVDTKIML